MHCRKRHDDRDKLDADHTEDSKGLFAKPPFARATSARGVYARPSPHRFRIWSVWEPCRTEYRSALPRAPSGLLRSNRERAMRRAANTTDGTHENRTTNSSCVSRTDETPLYLPRSCPRDVRKACGRRQFVPLKRNRDFFHVY